MINEIFEFIKENKELLFGGAGVALVTSTVNFFRNRKFASDNTVVHKIPEKIAKPDFSIKQYSLSSVAGNDPEYGFCLYNGGGDCFNVEVSLGGFPKNFKYSKIPRGGQISFSANIPRGTGFLEIIIKGINENGVDFSKFIHGEKFRKGFEFS